MHESVRQIFPGFSEKFEGRFRWPYLCVAGIPTVGIGCALGRVGLALALPWTVLEGGARATPLQVSAQWVYLKEHQALAQAGARACEHATQLRLTDADVDALLESRMAVNEAILAKRFRAWSFFQADAQLALHSLAWAVGAVEVAEGYPKLCAAAERGDWDGARAECTISGEDKNAGLIPRNVANRTCFANAARVRDNPTALRASEVYWPLELVQGEA
jgi:GH24 family phage-related lysozyme (muramidase)